MKRFYLLSVALLLMASVNAQIKRSKDYLKGGSDTTWYDLSGSFKRTKIVTGNVLMKQEPGKFKLYATYRKRKVTSWYAVDTKGNKIPATYTAKGAVCYACIATMGGLQHCYDVDCDDLPKPKTDAIRTAH